jgi:O-antigen ligase
MGVGAGNYQFFDLTYGTDVAGVAHNQYLEVLAEMGLQGLLCLLWVIAAVGYMAFKHFKAARTNIGKGLALASIGFYVSLINTGFFASSFVPSAALAGGTGIFVDLSYRWLLFGLVLSIPKWETDQLELRITQSDRI